ncbi:hypothetical protein mRhiFer1_009612 [Rhinolophus ferrumequinum]|uniref:Uncharacterized protein n=1 Tax=Rhinolophus ferrumequinum TaxID=59479 RepID=A0A7J7ZQM4_RHIFE|nr:hypothetical protein mRhiFer1_009612 [Rhinolophus ferrumequinum]
MPEVHSCPLISLQSWVEEQETPELEQSIHPEIPSWSQPFQPSLLFLFRFLIPSVEVDRNQVESPAPAHGDQLVLRIRRTSQASVRHSKCTVWCGGVLGCQSHTAVRSFCITQSHGRKINIRPLKEAGGGP